MSQQTVLQMVQGILGEMISDEITSIEDSEEARTVVRVLQRTYYDLAVSMDFPEHQSVFNLTETSLSTPILMTRPETAKNIQWVKYEKHTADNTDLAFETVMFLEIKDFLDRMYILRESDTNVDDLEYTVGGHTFSLIYRNDRHPECYTTFDDETLVFDSFNGDIDSFLRSAKTLCYGGLTSAFTLDDAFVPDIDAQHHPLLINTATARAFDILKDRIPIKIDRTARQLKVSAQRTLTAVEYGHPACPLPNYGRR